MGKESPFGTEARLKSLRAHYDETGPYSTETAWQFVYRELLWFDGSNGLAHLYESDKAQPGRSSWYDRTVRFTDQLQVSFGVGSRAELKAQLDRLFRDCLEKLLKAKADAKRKGEGLELEDLEESESGEGAGDVDAYVPDGDLTQEFAAILQNKLKADESGALTLARQMVARARHYFTVERKRQNILGEGFEDLLWLLATRVCGVPADRIKLRKRIDGLPGFAAKHGRDKLAKPDMAFVTGDHTDMLVSVKWSIRQDRQTQWADELDCYIELMSQDPPPKFLLVTNEYDPGRILNALALDRVKMKLDQIVHVSLDMLNVALSDHPTWKDAQPLVAKGRVRSLAQFLDEIKTSHGRR